MTTSDFVIETNALTHYFGSRKAVDSLTMRVPRGSVFAFLGRNGSGKTTTIRMLLGLLAPTRGSSTIMGEDSRSLSPATRGKIGYMSESHSVYDWMTVARAGYYQSRFYPNWSDRIFAAIIDHFGLAADTPARTLSRAGAAAGAGRRVVSARDAAESGGVAAAARRAESAAERRTTESPCESNALVAESTVATICHTLSTRSGMRCGLR